MCNWPPRLNGVLGVFVISCRGFKCHCIENVGPLLVAPDDTALPNFSATTTCPAKISTIAERPHNYHPSPVPPPSPRPHHAMARTRSSWKAAAPKADPPAPGRATRGSAQKDVVEEQEEDEWEEEEPEEVPLPKRATRSRKARENAPTAKRRSKRGKKVVVEEEEEEKAEEKAPVDIEIVEAPVVAQAEESPAAEFSSSGDYEEALSDPDTEAESGENSVEIEEQQEQQPDVEDISTTTPAEVERAPEPIYAPQVLPQDYDDTLDDDDDAAEISKELQRMANEMHNIVKPHVDEAAIDTELEQMSEEAAASEVRPHVAKTPKFIPEIHAKDDDFDVEDDSFELAVSPRKVAAPKPVAPKYKAVGPGASQKSAVAAATKAVTTTATTTKKAHAVSKPKDEKPKVEKTRTTATHKAPAAAVKKASPLPPWFDLAQSNLIYPQTAKLAPAAVPAKAKSATSAAPVRHRSVSNINSPPRAGSRSSSSETTATITTTTRREPSISSQAATANIPHSKTRAIGMSFPPPAPLAKSTKAPTTSTFELPGEAFQRKIKEQKEERKKRMEEEEQRRKEAKAKPVYFKPIPTVARVATSHHKPAAPSAGSRASIVDTTRQTTDLEKKPTFKKLEVRKPVAIVEVRNPVVSSKDELDREARAQSVLKARQDANERGRQTVKMWAEMQKQKEERAKAAATAAAT